jgi:hypothetical protein
MIQGHAQSFSQEIRDIVAMSCPIWLWAADFGQRDRTQPMSKSWQSERRLSRVRLTRKNRGEKWQSDVLQYELNQGAPVASVWEVVWM